MIIVQSFDKNFERLFVEIKIRHKKWLLSNPSYLEVLITPTNIIFLIHLTVIGKVADDLLASYDNIILLGDFNVEPDETNMQKCI